MMPEEELSKIERNLTFENGNSIQDEILEEARDKNMLP